MERLPNYSFLTLPQTFATLILFDSSKKYRVNVFILKISTMNNKMSQQRFYALIAAAIGMFGTFLPWVSAPVISGISGTAGDGWFTLILFGITFFILLQGDKMKDLDQKQLLAVYGTSGLAALFALWKITSFNNSISQFAGRETMVSGMFTSTVSVGIGLYLVVVAGVAVIGLAFTMKGKDMVSKEKGGKETDDKKEIDNNEK